MYESTGRDIAVTTSTSELVKVFKRLYLSLNMLSVNIVDNAHIYWLVFGFCVCIYKYVDPLAVRFFIRWEMILRKRKEKKKKL